MPHTQRISFCVKVDIVMKEERRQGKEYKSLTNLSGTDWDARFIRAGRRPEAQDGPSHHDRIPKG